MADDPAIPPLRDFPAGRLEQRAEHLCAEITRGRHAWHTRRPLRMRLAQRVALATVAAGVIGVGAAIASADWLTGSPAPPSVTNDFGTYSPQLGFHPDPGRSVLVAEDGDSQLYATTNSEGSYCVIVSAPWKRPDQTQDGGTCISKETADQAIVAGIPAGAADTVLLAGRVAVDGASSVRLRLPDGTARTIALGTSGFFLLSIDGKPCHSGEWSPQLVALAKDGTAVAASTITLERVEDGVACWLAPLTSQ